MLSLNNIKKSKGSAKGRKRVGRGNASGHGTYATRGQKGQRARSGVTNLLRLGMKQQLLQTPKVRGFKSPKPKNQAVNLSTINQKYQDGEIVNGETLFARHLISHPKMPVKILGKDKLTVKVKFEGVKMSESAKKQAA
jgi:large subunit ribosomal protein L15